MAEEVYTGVENYYGEVIFIANKGKYAMELDSYDGTCSVEVSKEFYDMAVKEFSGDESHRKHQR